MCPGRRVTRQREVLQDVGVTAYRGAVAPLAQLVSPGAPSLHILRCRDVASLHAVLEREPRLPAALQGTLHIVPRSLLLQRR